MAPEVRDGQPGDPASDVFTAGAVLYYAVTGGAGRSTRAAIKRPSELRPTTPQALERILLRALRPTPAGATSSAGEMLEDFASEAGTFETGVGPAGGRANRCQRRPRGATGRSGSAGRWATTTNCSRRLGPAGSAGSTGCATCTSSAKWRSRCCTRPHAETWRCVERFRREAQLAARLHHPNIVDIYDIAGASGLLWYTMELVRGPNLAQLVEREGPLPVRPGDPAAAGGAERARPRPWRRAWCTATSSRKTCSSPRTAPSRSPTSAWPSPSAARPLRRGHQPERHAPVRQSRSSCWASGWTSAATSTAWPRWPISRCWDTRRSPGVRPSRSSPGRPRTSFPTFAARAPDVGPGAGGGPPARAPERGRPPLSLGDGIPAGAESGDPARAAGTGAGRHAAGGLAPAGRDPLD